MHCINISFDHTAPSGIFINNYSRDGSPAFGQNYSLACPVTTDGDSYTWRKDGAVVLAGETVAAVLYFSPLRLTDAGLYSCEVRGTSELGAPFTIVKNHIVTIQGESTHTCILV